MKGIMNIQLHCLNKYSGFCYDSHFTYFPMVIIKIRLLLKPLRKLALDDCQINKPLRSHYSFLKKSSFWPSAILKDCLSQSSYLQTVLEVGKSSHSHFYSIFGCWCSHYQWSTRSHRCHPGLFWYKGIVLVYQLRGILKKSIRPSKNLGPISYSC